MKKHVSLRFVITAGLFIFCLYLFADNKPSTMSVAPHYIFVPATTCEHPYSFTNNETPAIVAKDLHIVFDKSLQVPPFSWSPVGAFGNGSYDQASGEVDLYGPGDGVAHGSAVSVTLGFANKNCGRVLNYWWTISGSSNQMNLNSNRLGPKHGNQKKGQFKFSMVPSTGNGLVRITNDGQQHNFNIPQGVTGDITAQLFATFVGNIPFGIVDSMYFSQTGPLPLNTVLIYFNAFDGSEPNFTVNIFQDSTQTTEFSYIETECIPTLSQWGLITLALLLIAGGMAFIRQRTYMPALAGGGSVPEERKRLFYPRLFFIVLSILWGIELTVFITDALIFHIMPVRDVIGTLVVSVILAYILHLLEAFRRD